MCDYSLHTQPNRLAVEGEELVTHRFPTYSIGLASPADIENARRAEAGGSWWSALKNLLSAAPHPAAAIPAVCVPPGARLLLRDIPWDTQLELRVGATEAVEFVQLSATEYRYRDALRFRTGRATLLQQLPEGLRMEVLSLASSGSESQAQEHTALVPAGSR
jgi:hypothetical protein